MARDYFEVYGQQYAVQFLNRTYKSSDGISDGLEIDFSIVYNNKSKIKTSKIIIWNLSRDTLNQVKAGMPIILSAGWPESNGILFQGEVVRIETAITKKGDTPTTFIVTQNKDIWFKSRVNLAWKGPVDTKTIVKDLVRNSSFSLGFVDESIKFTYKRDWSYNGYLKDALIELARDCGARTYNEDGKIVFMRPGRSVIKRINVFPEHILQSPKKTTKGNWKFTTILRWEGRPGMAIELQSAYLKGRFIVLACTHTRNGNKTFATQWEVSESGAPQYNENEGWDDYEIED